jgi:transposase, IS30 family
MDMLTIDQSEIDRYVELINNRPMKCLGYKTPNEIYNQHVIKILKNGNY